MLIYASASRWQTAVNLYGNCDQTLTMSSKRETLHGIEFNERPSPLKKKLSDLKVKDTDISRWCQLCGCRTVDSWYRKSISPRLRICSTTGVLGWLENVAIRDDSIESTNYRKKVIKIILAMIIRAKTGLNISANRYSPANRAHVMPAESHLGEPSQPASFNQALNARQSSSVNSSNVKPK